MQDAALAESHPYAAMQYGRALDHIGRALAVPEWGSFVLARVIAEGGDDAIGAYPLSVIAPEGDIGAGLARLRQGGLVSLVMTPDPLRPPGPQALAPLFDFCRPFKTHYLVDPREAVAASKHHRDRIRRGLRRCRVEIVSLAEHLEAWIALYRGLEQKRAISGAAAFKRSYFRALAEDRRMTAFAAFVDDAIAGMTIWFAHEGVAYNHLTASNAVGYANGVNYALYASAIDHFAAEGVINLGGGAGTVDDATNGLAAFKRGFANASVHAHIAGAVLDRTRYEALAAGRATDFFPAYRG